MEPDHYPLSEARREHVGSEGVAEDSDDETAAEDALLAMLPKDSPTTLPVGTENIGSLPSDVVLKQGKMTPRMRQLFEGQK